MIQNCYEIHKHFSNKITTGHHIYSRYLWKTMYIPVMFMSNQFSEQQKVAVNGNVPESSKCKCKCTLTKAQGTYCTQATMFCMFSLTCKCRRRLINGLIKAKFLLLNQLKVTTKLSKVQKKNVHQHINADMQKKNTSTHLYAVSSNQSTNMPIAK